MLAPLAAIASGIIGLFLDRRKGFAIAGLVVSALSILMWLVPLFCMLAS